MFMMINERLGCEVSTFNEKRKNKDPEDNYLDQDKISSTTECTGLVQQMPVSDEEADAYSELYDITPQEKQIEIEGG